jgi:nickel/cobalt transporter (NiCoT) family protein
MATHRVPLLAVLTLPILFAAGMSLVDTADGALMCNAYGWAVSNPVRRLYYNITVTSLSVVVALALGFVELVQVTFGRLQTLDLGKLGYLIVGFFLAAWTVSLVYWKAARVDERTAIAGVRRN